jgi:hypothetical protein
MALEYVTITDTLIDGSGSDVSAIPVFTPSQPIVVPGLGTLTPTSPIYGEYVNGQLKNSNGAPLQLLSTQTPGVSTLNGTGFWYWTVSGLPNGLGFSFFLPSSPSTVDLAALVSTPATPLSNYAALAGATFTGAVVPAVAALVDGATIAVNAAVANVFYVTLGGNRTMANPTNPSDGQVLKFRVFQPSSGGPYTLSWGGAYDFGAAGAPTLSTAASKGDEIGFEYWASKSAWVYQGSELGN